MFFYKKYSEHKQPYKFFSPINSIQRKLYVSLSPHSNSIDALSILELSNKKIVTGSSIGTITINTINYSTGTWSQHSKIEKAHNSGITSLIEITNNRLVSSSFDTTIKIWNYFFIHELKLIDKLEVHYGSINKVIPLTNNRFISCSYEENKIKLWNYTNTSYDLIPCSFEKQLMLPNTFVQLKKQKEVIAISCLINCLCFYSLVNPYKKLGDVKGVCANHRNGLIELTNGNIAVSKDDPPCIIIVDPVKFERIICISDNKYILGCGALCKLNDGSFLYAYRESLIQIAFWFKKFDVVFRTLSVEKGMFGNCGLILVNNGKGFVCDHAEEGINMFEVKKI